MTDEPVRCIATPTYRSRCRREALPHGTLYACREHGRLVTREMLDELSTAATRKMLALTEWETVDEGQALTDRLCGVGVA